MKRSQSRLFLVFVLILAISTAGCRSAQEKQDGSYAPKQKVTIAIQYGLAYAPLQIVQQQKLMEKYLPGTEIVWKQLGTGPVIRDAMVAGEVDIGFMGISPFLVGWDKGAQWKICTASGSQPVILVTYNQNIKSIKEFTANDKIATPALASIQHILLAMQAEKELGDAHALDNNLLSVTHPDAMAGLLSKKDVTAHFSSPPYLYKELQDPDIKEVLDGEDAFGQEFTFIFGVATEKFHDANPSTYNAFIGAFNEAVAFINQHPEEAAAILAPQYQYSEEETLRYLTWEGTNYCTTPYGIMGLAKFMHQQGFISKMPQSLDEIAFENVQAAIGNRYGEKSVIEMLQERDNANKDQ